MREIKVFENCKDKIVLGMGFFDSVHFGHRVLIAKVKELAYKIGAKSAITTFSDNPYKQFDSDAKLIYTYDERCMPLRESGLDYIIPFRFDSAFRNTGKDDFLKSLFERFDIAGIVCGYDYRFGNGGNGNAEYLKKVCAEKSIPIAVIEPVLLGGERVSSTLIKVLLGAGNVKKANELLASPYFMTGKVVHGRGVGKLYGFPTANIEVHADKMLVKNGVYATEVSYDGKVRKSVTNVGAKPTFGEDCLSVETLIKDEKADLYDKEITLRFVDYLRDIKKFSSPEELADRIRKDLEY